MGPTASSGLVGALGVTLKGKKIIYLISEDWYFCSHRLDLGIAAKKAGADVLVATQINKHGTEIEAAGLRVVPIMMQRSGHNPIADNTDIHHLPSNARAIHNQTTRNFKIKHRQSFYLFTCPRGGFPAQLDQ